MFFRAVAQGAALVIGLAWPGAQAGAQSSAAALAVAFAPPTQAGLRPSMPVVLATLVGLAVIVALVSSMRAGEGTRWGRLRRAIADDVRRALLPRRAWPAIALASLLVVAGHATAFVVAARAAGATAPLGELVALALVALLVMVLPSIAGWGPREGVTAWAFAAAGLGAAQGVATAVEGSVVQQTAATGEISRNVVGAADSTKLVVHALDGVATAAADAREAAALVLDNSEDVERAAGDLKREIEGFLLKVAV